MTKLYAKAKSATKATSISLHPSEIRLGDIDQLCKIYHCMEFERLTTFRGEPYLTETRVCKEDHKTLSSYKREILSRLNWAIKAEAKVTFSRAYEKPKRIENDD